MNKESHRLAQQRYVLRYPDRRRGSIKEWNNNSRGIAYKKEHRERNKENESNSRRNLYRKLKLKIFNLLGNRCIRCGYTGAALQIDHVNGGGCKEKARIKSGLTYYRYVLNKINSGSKEYQLLCANHNWEKRLDIIRDDDAS